MSKKTDSLSFPKDPLAAMRQLQELDRLPSNDIPPDPAEERDHATSLPDTLATSSEVSSVTTLPTSSQVSSEAAKPTATKRARRESEPGEELTDPIAGAVKELLARPYTTEGGKGPLTVSTVKMPSEVWERLGWAAKLTGQAKQDIIRDALKDYFRKLLKEL